ncbi:HipA domain-containing protein [Rhizobium sp. BR 317]|uniref:type II toxin-antitoxin system HipA family toxin n=1 Tax=Rhizobium sp. BR 317 TaxID=3040015 RepID=UPI0039BF8C9B
MQLGIETFLEGNWHQSGFITIKDKSLGFRGPSIVEYDIDYFMNFAAVARLEKQVTDARAMSVNHPVDLENRYRDTWPPFLLDLMPQGHARRKLAEHLRLDVDARASDVALLLRAGGNPVGNMRVTEAVTDELYRLARVDREGVTEDEIFQRTEHFIEVLDRFSMIASGSSGLQGEWPKVALTLATDGLYYPDMLVSDGEAVEHYIVKLLRSSEKRDRLILEAEAGYSVLAKTLGLNVHDTSRYENGVLMIRRFDREVAGGELARIGQESMVSALGVAAFGHLASHEDYIGVLKRHSDNAFADIVEYVKRDIANRALGNPDNHGRNSALSKRGDGSVRLSPLFDFAPMKLAVEGVARSTRWAAMRDLHRDTTPDWDAVCRAIFEDEAAASALREEISAFAVRLLDAPSIAAAVGIPEEATELAMRDCISVAENALGK